MTNDKLTKRQTEILNYIIGFMRENGYAPSYREIGEQLGISSTATVHEHVKNLEAKGFLRDAESGSARSIDVAPAVLRAVRAIELPLLGLIAAGQPIEAVTGNETLEVPASLAGDGDAYVLKVKGESMIEDGINSGDYVVVERDRQPRDGDIVVAILDNMYATLKRFYREPGRIRLQPANRTMQPIYVKDCLVQGVVRGLIRNYAS